MDLADVAQQLDGPGEIREAMHAHGVGDEATAECYAMQSIPRTARLLGLGDDKGRYLADFFWDEWYPLLDSG